VVVYGQNSAQNTQTDQRPTTSRASAGQNILPNPPKSPSRVPILEDTPAAPVAPSIDFNDTLNRFREELSKSLEESLGVQINPSKTTYRKPYPSHFDFIKASDGWKVPDFNKFSGDDSKSTMEHINMFLAQLGEASAYDFMKVHNFLLSLIGTAFAWFTSLPVRSIGSWAELEEKFHSHFCTGIHETRLSHLASVRQGHDEAILDFVKRFREIKNRCFHIMIAERDFTDLCFAGLCLSIRHKLEHHEFMNVNQLLQRAVSAESRLKESCDTYKSNHNNVHVVDDHSDCSDDDNKEVCPAEIKWPIENKMVTCPSLKMIHKNQGEEMKFTYDFSKCDRIFDELLKFGYFRINYALPSADELKRRAYCKYHNSFSHATNDSNIFRRQVQSAFNEGVGISNITSH
jgi:hypothetical protein